MLYFYSQMGINLKFVTSNNPLSVIFISGITGNDKNDNIKKGLKSILDEIAFSEECKLFKSEITSFDELKPGAYGILEPDAGIPASADDGLMIMPGVAFDTNRNRVGYGGGYYDRYLESHPQLHTLALAFDMQVLFEVPAEEQDIKPQLLVTETNIYQEG